MDRSAIRRWIPAAGFALLLLVTSLVPIPANGDTAVPTLLGVGLDKWVHAVSYGVLTGLLARGRQSQDVAGVTAVVLVAIGYGAGVEVLQGFVPSRGTSGADVLANAVGAVLAGAAVLGSLKAKLSPR
ncbi:MULTISPECIES: VanZ family protein [Haloarcula]|uniref:VanZ family protein n=1 Tax=Haloarcula TaxID=2237 RepID=UPI0023EABADE|nr:VanZ family protein [Halomicroarcula sp. XH51]